MDRGAGGQPVVDGRAGRLGRNGDFVRLWAGGAVSGLGTSVAALAYSLLALSVTGSAGRAGLVGLVALGAGALVRLPAGALVDRMPLRRVLVGADVLRAVATAALVTSVLTGHLALWQLVVTAPLNAAASVVSEIAHSVALRHVVPAAQLSHAFALNEGRGHAIGLAGQPVGGLLYGIAPALPLAADVASFIVSAVVSATLKAPLQPSATSAVRPRLRSDLFTGLAFVWHDPFLRATLLCAAGFQLVTAAATFTLVASFTAAGASAASLGLLFALAAAGGVLGAVAAPVLQARLRFNTVVTVLGWTATLVFAVFAGISQPLLAGILLGCIFFTAPAANAVILAAQVSRTPAPLQGRVMAASYLIAGLAAPLGPPAGGTLLDASGPVCTFMTIAGLTGLLTLGVHLSRAMRTRP